MQSKLFLRLSVLDSGTMQKQHHKIQACSLFVLNCLLSSLSAPGVLKKRRRRRRRKKKKKKKKKKEEEEEEEEESHSLFFYSVCTYYL